MSKCQLAADYIQEMKRHYGVRAYVPDSLLGKFIDRERLVIKEGYASSKYAGDVAKLLAGWCEDKKLRYPPPGVFVGDFAYSKFIGLVNKPSIKLDGLVSIDELLHTAYHSEFQLYTLYYDKITHQGMYISELDLVELFIARKMPNCEWLTLFHSGRRSSVTLMVIHELIAHNPLYSTTKVITNYEDLMIEYTRNAMSKLAKFKGELPGQVNLAHAARFALNQQISSLEFELLNLRRALS